VQAADDVERAIVGQDRHPARAQVTQGYVVPRVNE
jgi:hypothetical protein